MMTLEQIQKLIASHYANGKRNIGQLRRAVKADVTEGSISSDRLSRLIESYLRDQVKAFGGEVRRIGKERLQFSALGDVAQKLVNVTYGKAATQAESVLSAIDLIKAAWKNGKEEPKNARRTVLNSVYMPEDQGGLPQTKDFDRIRQTAFGFVEECKRRNEEDRIKREKAAQAEKERKDREVAEQNRKAAERKAAQAAQAAKQVASVAGSK